MISTLSLCFTEITKVLAFFRLNAAKFDDSTNQLRRDCIKHVFSFLVCCFACSSYNIYYIYLFSAGCFNYWRIFWCWGKDVIYSDFAEIAHSRSKENMVKLILT